jgi:adenylate cyclase, class 2
LRDAGCHGTRRAVDQVAELRAALSSALGIKVVVAKKRSLFLWNEVRIHLDEVKGLGNFIEFEAVAGYGSDLSREKAHVATMRRRSLSTPPT